MNFNSLLSAIVFLISSFHHVTSRGVQEAVSEFEAAAAAPSSYYTSSGGRDGDAVFEVLRRSPGGELGIKDALKYIDALDAHYGKYTSSDDLANYEVEKRSAQNFIDDVELKMAQMSRPRFGKRSMPRVDSRRQYQNYLKGL